MDNLSEMISALTFHDLFGLLGAAENAFDLLFEVVGLIEGNRLLDRLSDLIVVLGLTAFRESRDSLGQQVAIEYVLIVLHLVQREALELSKIEWITRVDLPQRRI